MPAPHSLPCNQIRVYARSSREREYRKKLSTGGTSEGMVAMPDQVETLETHCCIAGGGPAGMMLGFLLARAGH